MEDRTARDRALRACIDAVQEAQLPAVDQEPNLLADLVAGYLCSGYRDETGHPKVITQFGEAVELWGGSLGDAGGGIGMRVLSGGDQAGPRQRFSGSY